MRRKTSTGLNVGGSSILVIFVLLCLTTFATLSMVSANANYKLTLKTAESSSLYYAADATAEMRLREIDLTLADAASASNDAISYYSNVAAFLALSDDLTLSNHFFMMGLDDAQIVQEQLHTTIFTIAYSVPVSEQQELCVLLEVLYPAAPEASRYQVLSWTLTNTATPDEFIEEEPIHLFTGEWN